MLSNAYFLAKFRFDTAENEPAKILQNLSICQWCPSRRRRGRRAGRGGQVDFHDGTSSAGPPSRCTTYDASFDPSERPVAGHAAVAVGKISAKGCSFSAVSAPIFATKYAFCSIFQNLPDFQAEIFEIWQYFANFAAFAKFLLELCPNQLFFDEIFAEFCRNYGKFNIIAIDG